MKTVDELAQDLIIADYRDIRKFLAGANISVQDVWRFRCLEDTKWAPTMNELQCRGYTMCFFDNKDCNYYCYSFLDGKWQNVDIS